MRHVIIGNSAAAVGAIEAIREHDQDNPITVVADEPHHVYSRPLISICWAGRWTTAACIIVRPISTTVTRSKRCWASR